MSALDRIVPITITRQSQFPSLPAYNTILIALEFLASQATPIFTTAERVRVYTGGAAAILASLSTSYGGTSSVIYKMAQQAFAQNPSVNTLYIGRKLTGVDGTETWTAALTAIALANNAWYGFVTPDRTLANQEAIATWIETNGKFYITDSEDVNIHTSTGDIAEYLHAQEYTRSMAIFKNDANWRDSLLFTFSGAFVTGNKATPTISGTALGEITFSTTSLAMMQALKAEIEVAYPLATVTIDDTAHTILIYQKNKQWDITLKGLSNSVAITGGTPPTCVTTYPNDASDPWIALSLMSYAFALSSSGTNIPGSVDWAYLQLTGVAVDTLTPNQITTITGKNGNFYSAIAGVNVFQFGTVGDGEHADVIIGLDYISSLIQNYVFTLLINRSSQPKVPYTDVGITQVAAQLSAALESGVKGGILINPTITVPKAADISSATKATRALAGVNWTATLVGAIETVPISGIVTY